MHDNLDMDGKEVRVGDIVLVATNALDIRRARVCEIGDYGYASLEMIISKRTTRASISRLLKI